MVHVNNAVGIAAPCQHNIDGRKIESSDLKFEHVTMSRLIQQKKEGSIRCTSTFETRIRTLQESPFATDHGEVR